MNGKCTGGGELRGIFTLIELLIVISMIAIVSIVWEAGRLFVKI